MAGSIASAVCVGNTWSTLGCRQLFYFSSEEMGGGFSASFVIASCVLLSASCSYLPGSASSTTPHGVAAGSVRSATAVPQDQQHAASGAFDGGAAGTGLTSRDAILRVIRRNLDSRRMPPQSTKDGK